VPENAYLDDSGSGWKCARGFTSGGDRCTALVVPENGHLDFAGNSWTCDRGYRERAGGCVEAR